MSAREAVEALQRLGLSTYEAKVFVALHRLGEGTAREVHEVADVPRSQVYGAADALEERGLVELQQSTPKRYRPVDIESARRQLQARLEREQERAFESLAAVQRDSPGGETREDVWSVRGREPITERVVALIDRAEDRLAFGAARPDLVPEPVATAVRAAADRGVSVVVVSEHADVRALFPADPVTVAATRQAESGFTGRMVLADDDAVLFSVLAADEDREFAEETAIYSVDTAMAAVLAGIARDGLAAIIEQ